MNFYHATIKSRLDKDKQQRAMELFVQGGLTIDESRAMLFNNAIGAASISLSVFDNAVIDQLNWNGGLE